MKSKKILCLITLSMIISQGFLLSTVSANQATTQTVSTHRLAGENRYSTSIAISQSGWTKSDTVILASGEKFADALCVGPLAKKYNSPILLISSTSIGDSTLKEINRLQAKNIILVGGTGAVSKEVENQLKSAGYVNIDRIGGKDRYETSSMIAKRLDKTDKVVIASGENFPDALSISTVASKLGMPILLSNKHEVSESVKQFIESNNIKQTYIVGGEGVLSSAVEKLVPSPIRLSGEDRYGTNLAVIKQFDKELNFDKVYLALGNGPTGDEFADALSGAALACNTSSPILITNKSIDNNVNEYIKSKLNLNTKAIALGGQSVVPDTLIKTIMDEKVTVSVTKIYDKAGSYSGGEINGSVTISATGVNLKNTVIKGDLLIASTVNDGDIYLDNVKVTGKTVINGGGAHSVRYSNGNIGNINIDKPIGEETRVVIGENASADFVTVESNGIIEHHTDLKVGNITVEKNSTLKLIGNFDNVEVKGEGSKVSIENGTVNALKVLDSAKNSIVNISGNSKVKTLNVNAAVDVKGKGKIETAFINAQGSTLEQKPSNLNISSGVSSNVNGKTETSTTSTGGNGGGSSSGGSSNSILTIKNVNVISDINVANGTVLNAAGLPSSVNITLSDSTTTSAAVTWDGGSPAYDGNAEGSYNFTGTITLPSGVTNPSNVKASVNVKVAAPVVQEKTISSVNAINDINVSNGTAVTAAGLPSSVNITLSDNTITSAAVAWDGGSPAYDGSAEGSYSFTGTIILPSGVTNPSNVRATVKVKVAAPVVQEKTISSVETINDINVSNGTALTAAGLPSSVNITLSDNTTTSAAVTWDGGSPAYDGSAEGSYSFTGTITLPVGVTNPSNVRATVKVKVAAPVVQEKTISSVETINDINVSNGTALTAAGLPSSVNITLSDNTTTSAAVTWDGGSPAYDGSAEGSYNFTGTITLPSGVTNPSNVKASVNVKVAAPVVQEKTINSVNAINDINVSNGTAVTAAGLPSSVNITLSDNTTTSAAVAWDGGSPAYDGSAEGSYSFTGTITLPVGVTNPSNVRATVKVKVAAPVVKEKTISSVETINDINVSNGTALTAAGLPSSVNITLSDNTTTSAAVTWDGGSPAYDGSAEGSYSFTGTITLPSGVINPGNVKASVNIKVAALALVIVSDGSVAGATAGNTNITGLTSGRIYKITTGTTTMYTKNDGTLTQNAAEKSALGTGITEIRDLVNGTTYKVEILSNDVTITSNDYIIDSLAGDIKSNVTQINSNVDIVTFLNNLAKGNNNADWKVVSNTVVVANEADFNNATAKISTEKLSVGDKLIVKAEDGTVRTYLIEVSVINALPTKIYWVDYETRQIFKSNLDGSGVVAVLSNDAVALPGDGPVDITVDNTGRKIYWRTGTEIRTANLDGTGWHTIVTNIFSPKGGLALDAANNKLYFGVASTVNGAADSKICSVDLNNNISSVLYQGVNISNAILANEGIMDLEAYNGKLYWSTSDGLVKMADLNSSNITTIDDTNINGNWINGIAIDSSTSSIYWIVSNPSNLTEKKVVKADLNNLIKTDVVTGPLMNMVDEYDNPMHITIGGGNIYWTTNYSKLFTYDGVIVREIPIPVLNGIPEIYQDGGITLSWEN